MRTTCFRSRGQSNSQMQQMCHSPGDSSLCFRENTQFNFLKIEPQKPFKVFPVRAVLGTREAPPSRDWTIKAPSIYHSQQRFERTTEKMEKKNIWFWRHGVQKFMVIYFRQSAEGTAQIIKKPSSLIMHRKGQSAPLRSFSNHFRLTSKNWQASREGKGNCDRW